MLLVLLLITSAFITNSSSSSSSKTPTPVSPDDAPTQEVCPVSVVEKEVRGTSLYPLVSPGSKVLIALGYFKCRPVQRGDIAMLSHAGSKYPIVKIVKGLSGDSFGLQRTQGGHNILVNDQVVRNSQGRPYVITEQGKRMIGLYVKDYNGKIPPGAYMVLGDQTHGTLDSTRFGLVDGSEFAGKMLLTQEDRHEIEDL